VVAFKESEKDAERRRRGEAEDRGGLVPLLRDVSRQEYLKKREELKLEELRDELEDAK
jgi:pre-mRNA-splicing factor ATP-dependent RNA helicase DHX16